MALVSIIIPVKNAERFLDECLGSVAAQTYRPLEVSIYDDGCSDGSVALIEKWSERLKEVGVAVCFAKNPNEPGPGRSGPGFAKNRATENCHGEYLCFLDADDIAKPIRIEAQMYALMQQPEEERARTLVGCNIERIPEGSTGERCSCFL
jgi:teichuronic acid biosynthesis glycosyltransferase TuaG